MRKIQLGSVSTGTLRTEDLLDAVIGEVTYLCESNLADGMTKHHQDRKTSEFLELFKAYNGAQAITDYDSDEAGYALEELIDAMQYLAPAHVRFGAHEGDGADFGWWPTDFDGCQLVSLDNLKDHLTLSHDTKQVDVSCGLLVEINDHGNMTVRELGGETIWDCV